MDLGLRDKVAVVTGASKGIGLAVARALADEGAQVAAGARELTDDLAKLARDHPVHQIEVDLADPAGPGRLVDEAVARFGGLDILVNNVGATRARTDGFLAIDDDEWTFTLTLNFLAAVRTTRAAVPHLLDRGGGAIVSTCSVNAFLPDPLVIDYSAAKGALANFSKALSKELGPRGVRVNTVSPGPVATDLWLGKGGMADTVARSTGADADRVQQQAVGGTPTGRFSRPEEVADLIVFLAGARAANVTGADFVIDGGLVQTL